MKNLPHSAWMQRSFYFILLVVVVALSIWDRGSVSKSLSTKGSQIWSSEHGNILPASGTIRGLLIFAQVDYSNCPNNDRLRGNWPPNSIPENANEFMDDSLVGSQLPQSYITDYYFQASFGLYRVLGDYIPEVVTIQCRDLLDRVSSTKKVFEQLNNGPHPIETANVNPNTGRKYNLNDFDSWGSQGPGLAKTNQPDGSIDFAVVIWKNNHLFSGCTTGLGVQRMFNNPLPLGNKTVRIAGSFNSCSIGDGAFNFFLTEYMHALFGGNNWHSSSGAGLHTFNVLSRSYGVTAQQEAESNAASAWDRYHLGWKQPNKRFLLSAINERNLEEVETDLTIENLPNGGTFILRDFYTHGDAIRIKLPHLDWTRRGNVKNQYIWIENRQLVNRFDRSFWENVPGKDPWMPGMYIQLQVGKDIKFGTPEEIFSCQSEGCADQPNALGSWLLHLTAEGNYDFLYRYDQFQHGDPSSPCNWNNPNVPIEKIDAYANPLTGFSDLYKAIDSAETFEELPTEETFAPFGDGLLFSQDKIQAALSEIVDGTVKSNCHSRGDNEDAFRLSGNHKLALGTNPAPVTALTHRSTHNHGAPNRFTHSFDNNTVYLNNLSIEILSERVFGAQAGSEYENAIIVRISWDHSRVEDDVRWAGNIVLQNDIHDPLKRQSKIVVASGKTICLDRGLSPTKHVANSSDRLFTDPTVLTIKTGTSLHLEKDAQIIAINGSKIQVEENVDIQLDEGSLLDPPEAHSKTTCVD